MRRERGFTLLELMLVCAIIGVLVTIAFSLYAGMQRSARVVKAQADVKMLATAVAIWRSHMDQLPTTLAQVTSVTTNSFGQILGPYIPAVPAPPSGWGTYTYTPVASAGTFTITSSGDGTSVVAP